MTMPRREEGWLYERPKETAKEASVGTVLVTMGLIVGLSVVGSLAGLYFLVQFVKWAWAN